MILHTIKLELSKGGMQRMLIKSLNKRRIKLMVLVLTLTQCEYFSPFVLEFDDNMRRQYLGQAPSRPEKVPALHASRYQCMNRSCNATEQCFENNEAKQRFEKWSTPEFKEHHKCSNRTHARGARLPKVTMLICMSTNGHSEEKKMNISNPAYKPSRLDGPRSSNLL
jgi:hypothetical protein